MGLCNSRKLRTFFLFEFNDCSTLGNQFLVVEKADKDNQMYTDHDVDNFSKSRKSHKDKRVLLYFFSSVGYASKSLL